MGKASVWLWKGPLSQLGSGERTGLEAQQWGESLWCRRGQQGVRPPWA